MGFLLRSILPFLGAIYLSILIGSYTDTSKEQYLLLGVLCWGILLYLLNIFYQKYGKTTNKMMALAALGLSALLLLAGHPYLVPKNDANNHYVSVTITATGEKNPQANGSEVWVQGLKNAGESYGLNQIHFDSSWEKKDLSIVSYRHQPATLRITVENAKSPSILFRRHPWSGKIRLFDGRNTDTVDLYSAGTNDSYNYPIKNLQDYVYREQISLKRIVFFGLTFLFLFSVFYPLLTIVADRNKNYYLVNILLGIPLFLFPSPLTFTAGETVLLLALSVIAGKIFSKALEPGGYLRTGLGKRGIFVLILITLYASFACVGNAFFVSYPEKMPRRLPFLYLLFACWFFVIEIAFLQIVWRAKLFLQASGKALPGPADRAQVKQIWGITFLFLTTVWTIYLLAFFPGVMSADSLEQWAQSTGLAPLNNWQPVFHTLFNKALILPNKSPAAIAFGQIVFMAAVAAAFLSLLYRRGLPRNWLLAFGFLFALIPSNGINVITLWKDIPFAISLLWLTQLIVAIVADPSRFGRNNWNYPGLILALVAVALFRHNGTVTFLVTAAGLLGYAFKNKARPVWISVALSLVLIVSYNMFVLNRRSVVPVPAGVRLIAPFNGMAAVMKRGLLSADVQQKMETVISREEWDRLYWAYWANGYQFHTGGRYTENLSKISTGEALKMYLTTLRHHPGIVIGDRLQGSDIVWNVYKPEGVRNLSYYTEIDQNPFGLVQKKTELSKFFLKYLKASEELGSIFFWRAGIYNIFIFLLIFFVFRSESKKMILMFLPWLGSCLSLFPAVAWQEYRYVYFVFLLFGFLFLTVLSRIVTLKTPDKTWRDG